MLKRTLFLLSGIFLLGTCFLVFESVGDKKDNFEARQEVKYKKMKEAINKINVSSGFYVSGIILDDNNKPLDDVTMKIRFSKLNVITWGTIDTKKEIVTRSPFTVQQSGYSGLSIDFIKDGYFPERRFYSILRPSQYSKENVYIKKDEKIILRKIGKLAKIKKFEKLLKHNWEKNERSFCVLTDLLYKTLPVNSVIKAKKYIYLDFERDKNGKVIMIKDRYNRQIPKTLIITYVSEDKNDGFIIKGNQPNMTYLPQAPSSGYDEKSIKMPYKSQDIYFYYKCGDHYGKGALLVPETSGGESNVWLRLMQNIEEGPKERRNLRSRKF